MHITSNYMGNRDWNRLAQYELSSMLAKVPFSSRLVSRKIEEDSVRRVFVRQLPQGLTAEYPYETYFGPHFLLQWSKWFTLLLSYIPSASPLKCRAFPNKMLGLRPTGSNFKTATEECLEMNETNAKTKSDNNINNTTTIAIMSLHERASNSLPRFTGAAEINPRYPFIPILRRVLGF